MIDPVLQLDPLHRLILAYANKGDRKHIALAFALDGRFAEIIRSTSETLIGQMRLTWWRDILTMPAGKRPSGEPLIEQIGEIEEQGISLAPLLELLEGWEFLLDDFPWDDRHFDQYAERRGGGLFQFCLTKPMTDSQLNCSKSWAWWDFARHCSDESMREIAFQKSGSLVAQSPRSAFDRNGRPLAILCHLVVNDVRKNTLTADLYRPKTAAKIIWHGVTGF